MLVVEGSIPVGNDGVYCTIGGRTAVDILAETAAGAAAIIATGNCAAYGGIPKAKPNPTDAKGVMDLITDKAVVNIPGCPAIPESFTGTLANFLIFGELPELDDLGRPKTFYGTTIHDRCLRRPFYEAGKFARQLRRRRGPAGLVPLQARLQGPDYVQRMCHDEVGRRSLVPDSVGPPLPRVLAAEFLGRRRFLPGSVCSTGTARASPWSVPPPWWVPLPEPGFAVANRSAKKKLAAIDVAGGEETS